MSNKEEMSVNDLATIGRFVRACKEYIENHGIDINYDWHGSNEVIRITHVNSRKHKRLRVRPELTISDVLESVRTLEEIVEIEQEEAKQKRLQKTLIAQREREEAQLLFPRTYIRGVFIPTSVSAIVRHKKVTLRVHDLTPAEYTELMTFLKRMRGSK